MTFALRLGTQECPVQARFAPHLFGPYVTIPEHRRRKVEDGRVERQILRLGRTVQQRQRRRDVVRRTHAQCAQACGSERAETVTVV